jgi:hypothetical protein
MPKLTLNCTELAESLNILAKQLVVFPGYKDNKAASREAHIRIAARIEHIEKRHQVVIKLGPEWPRLEDL